MALHALPNTQYVDQAILIVTSGPQSGARMSLAFGNTYTIGVDQSSEIVLRGAVSDASLMQITITANGVTGIDSAGKAFNVNYQDEISFGSARFFIVKNNESVNQVTSCEVLANAVPADEQAVSEREQVASLATKTKHRLFRPVLYATVIVASAMAALTFNSWQGGHHYERTVAYAPLESHLADEGFGHLQVDRSRGNTIVTGYVPSRQQALNLAQIIETNDEVVLNRVSVDEEVKDQIEDVLRVNGISALVESLGNGAFVANTQLSNASKLESLQSMIETDVPQIASFSINNQLPVPPLDEVVHDAEKDLVQMDSGKRVVLVNSESPAYVVTTDQSRYFIGSVLPGGYRITSILDGRVLLDKQGKTTELKF